MPWNSKTILDALGDAIADEASLARTGTSIAIWTHDVIEDFAGDPYTVLRIYGGPSVPVTPIREVAVQAMTVGADTSAAWTQAEAVFDVLRGSDERPRRDWSITGGTVAGIRSLRPPGQIGRDPRGRVQLAANFVVAFRVDE